MGTCTSTPRQELQLVDVIKCISIDGLTDVPLMLHEGSRATELWNAGIGDTR